MAKAEATVEELVGMIERGERNLSLSNIGVFAKVFAMSESELLDFDNSRGER